MKIKEYIDSIRAKETEEEDREKRENIAETIASQKFEEIQPDIRMKVVRALMDISADNRNAFIFKEFTGELIDPEENYPAVDTFKYPHLEKSVLSFSISLISKQTIKYFIIITSFRDAESVNVNTALYQQHSNLTVDSKNSLEEFLLGDFEESLTKLLLELNN